MRGTARLYAASLLISATSCREAPTPEGPVVRLVSHEFSLEVPTSLPAGLVHLRLINEGQDIHEALITRMTSDAGTADRYVEQWKAGNSWPEFAADVGGTALTAPGDSSDVWMRLSPGRYAVICTKGDHVHRGMAADLVVRAQPGAQVDTSTPGADLELALLDYAYTFPGTVTAGAHRIHIVNRGTEPHEMDIYRLELGQTLDDLIRWTKGDEAGAPPLALAGGGGDLLPGGEEWIAVNLRPGRYVMLCTIPQGKRDDGTPHHALGMIRYFTVP